MDHDMLLSQFGSIGWQEWAALIVASLPPLFVLYSKRVRGGKKVLWFVLTSLLSWLAYVVFLVMTRAGDAARPER